MRPAAERRASRARRFVHLGERLVAVARIRAGAATVEETALALGVDPAEVAGWLSTHAGERMHSLEELRQGSPEHARLAERVRRLAALVAESERALRDLHQELIRGIDASNDADAGSSKEFALNSHFDAPGVAPPQRKASATRKFVDGDSTR
jgi:transposase-like protein